MQTYFIDIFYVKYPIQASTKWTITCILYDLLFWENN